VVRAPVVQLCGVCKSFGSGPCYRRVLDGIDLVVHAGTMVAVTGPSGSGKTTLLHLVALLDRPDQGEIFLNGRATRELDENVASRLRAEMVGMVFQRYHLLGHRTVLENVLFGFRYLPVPRSEAIERSLAALEQVGLASLADRPARLLSGGEMQRVALARGLAKQPCLLIADEPTGNLDAICAQQVMGILESVRAQGVAVLLATHNPAWAGRCDAVVQLGHGQPGAA